MNLAGRLLLQLQAVPSSDAAFVLINDDGDDPVNGAFSNLPEGGPPLIIHATGVDYLFTANYHYDAAGDGGDNDVALTMTAVATPEPGGIAAIGLLMMLKGCRRRSRRSINDHKRSI